MLRGAPGPGPGIAPWVVTPDGTLAALWIWQSGRLGLWGLDARGRERRFIVPVPSPLSGPPVHVDANDATLFAVYDPASVTELYRRGGVAHLELRRAFRALCEDSTASFGWIQWRMRPMQIAAAHLNSPRHFVALRADPDPGRELWCYVYRASGRGGVLRFAVDCAEPRAAPEARPVPVFFAAPDPFRAGAGVRHDVVALYETGRGAPVSLGFHAGAFEFDPRGRARPVRRAAARLHPLLLIDDRGRRLASVHRRRRFWRALL